MSDRRESPIIFTKTEAFDTRKKYKRYTDFQICEEVAVERDYISDVVKACINPNPPKFIQLRSITLVGYMESGKSTFAKVFCYLLKLFYLMNSAYLTDSWEKNVKILYADSFSTILDYIDDIIDENIHYVVMIVDDAIEHQSSKAALSLKSRTTVASLAKIRHLLKDAGMEWGMAVVIFATQRWRELLPFLRNSLFAIYKSVLTEEAENRAIGFEIGQDNYEFLQAVTEAIYLDHNQGARNLFVAKSAWGVEKIQLPNFELAALPEFQILEALPDPTFEAVTNFVATDCSDIFEMGRHSFTARMLKGRVYEKFGVDLDQKYLQRAIDRGIARYFDQNPPDQKKKETKRDLSEYEEVVREAAKLDKITVAEVQAIACELTGEKLPRHDDEIIAKLAKRKKKRRQNQ